MPEFYLDVDADQARWSRLDSFTQGYVQALFFTEMEHGTTSDDWNPETQSSLPGDVTFADLSQTAYATISADCTAFQEKYATILDMARELVPGDTGLTYAREALDDTRLGQLFWYARNGHGVAFTDDGDADCLKSLQQAAQACSGLYVCYGDDKMVHLS